MAIIKCKMCGGDMELSPEKTFGVCEYCGSTMTLPKVSDEQRTAAFNRGNHFRRTGEFDKALAVYERIVAEDDTDAEAHWCCALCRFGIEYVEDPVSYEWLPTCHRASFDSFLEDVDYLAALEHSDGITRRQYQKDAAKIAEVQRGILATSQNTEPYDVFISYKELDANGERTRDSILAQDIYYRLTEQGRRVFFSRITLEDIPGTQYEPYIFAALNSAKVMIVVGTSAENLNAVWVKNEWSRFLAMMRKDKGKLLIPCYRDMDPYDLPEQLAVLMSYDMGRIGFLQDLVRGVNKVLDADRPKEIEHEPVKETVVVQQNSGGPNVQALLDRGNMALEDEEWENAADFFNRALDMDAKCGEAYLGMFLVENECRNVEEYAAEQIERLRPCEEDMLVASRAQEERIEKAVNENALTGYLGEKEIRDLFDFDLSQSGSLHGREEQLRKTERFFSENRLLSRAKQYASPETAEKLKKMEGKILAFLKDAVEKAREEEENCIEVAEAEAARMGQEARRRREADYEEAYEKACRAFEQASEHCDYVELTYRFWRLGGYKDSAEMKRRCEDAQKRLKEQKEKEAKEKKKKFLATVDTKGAKYAAATELFAGGEYEKAEAAFESLGDYKDSAAKRKEAKYAAATEQFVSGDYVKAEAAFEALGHYKDSVERKIQIRQAWYAAAEADYAVGKYAEAAILYFRCGNMNDSREKQSEAAQRAGIRKIGEAVDAGESITVGLKSNGRVVAAGSVLRGQCEVNGWRDIVAVSAGSSFTVGAHTVGLKADGTVIAAGRNGNGQCDVSAWRDIVAVSAGGYHTVGLKLDGTVIAVGWNKYGQCDVGDWWDIVAISAGGVHTVGLKSDGTVVAVGYNESGQCDVDGWRNIVAVSAGGYHTVGLKSNGTVVAVGANGSGQCNIGDWTDIVAVSAGGYHTVGLKSDGTAVAVGANGSGQCNIGDWTDIVAVSAGHAHTVGLKSDGTVVAVGYNESGQCDVSGWTDIKVPKA